jgi:hypothetical protein
MIRKLAFPLPILFAAAVSVSAVAQDNRDTGGHDGNGGGASAAAPAPASAPATASRGSDSSHGNISSRGGSSRQDSAGEARTAPHSGRTAPESGRTDGQARPRGERPENRSGAADHPDATTSTGDHATSAPTYSRPREGRRATGDAVERRSSPRSGGTPPIVVGTGGYYGGYYPWGWGGLGYGGYYGGVYDPFYDPYSYEPYPTNYSYANEGALRLKVKPREASVYVDGYFAGQVDNFDGVFQRLHLDSGPHRIELRQDGYEPLTFEVRIQPDRTVTYTAEMTKTP